MVKNPSAGRHEAFIDILSETSTPEWLPLVLELEIWAVLRADIHRRRETIATVLKFSQKVVLLADLIEHFDRSPRRAIGGPTGVAAAIGLSKTAVQKKIHALGLVPDDFRRQGVQVQELIEKSHVMCESLAAIRTLHTEHCLTPSST